MTEYNENDEEEEIERLKKLLRTSSEHLSKHVPDRDEPKKRKRNRKDGSGDGEKKESQTDEIVIADGGDKEDADEPKYTTDDTELVLPSRKKKAPKKKVVELTPEELKSAKAKHKSMQRKLTQIEQRHDRKKRRKELYDTIHEHALPETEMQLMEKSAHLGKRVTKKEEVKKLLQKERAGIELTEEERGKLYTDTERVDEEEFEKLCGSNTAPKASNPGTNEPMDEDEVVPLAFSSSGRKKKKSTKKQTAAADSSDEKEDDVEMDSDNEENAQSEEMTPESNTESAAAKPKFSFAAQMMAGLSSLKTTATEQTKELDEKRAKEEAEVEEKRLRAEEEERKNRTVYVPQNPAILKSAAAMGIKPKADRKEKDGWRVLPVDRPAEVNATRYDLPVSTM
jgi:hypothetical protein